MIKKYHALFFPCNYYDTEESSFFNIGLIDCKIMNLTKNLITFATKT